MIGFAALVAASPAAANTQSPDLAAYVRGRAAEADGAAAQAASDYQSALEASPGNALVAARAYREGLTAGDMALALRSVRTLRQAGVAPPDSSLLLLADAVARGESKDAVTYAGELANGPLDFLQPVVLAWLSADRDPAEAAATLSDKSGNALGRRYANEHRALLLIAAGNADKAMKILDPMLVANRADLDLRLNAAQLLADKGYKELALRLLGGDNPTMVALRGALGDGTKPTPAFGVSRVYTELASSLNSDRLQPLSTLLIRAALMMAPDYDRARLTLADSLSRQGDDAAAEQALAGIGEKSGLSRMAAIERREVLERAGDNEGALSLGKSLADALQATVSDVRAYGDLLADAGRYDDAAVAYGQAIALAGDQAGWALYLQRGGALEQAGQWGEALPLLNKAVALAPDEPVALNYLAYAKVERGEDLSDAQAMLERALKLKPGDPSIVDSLGWAYYKRGALQKALPLLEQAAQAEPSDVTINEHLGDAYWRAGRRYEARYAWRAAAIYADDHEAERLRDKIADGLGEAS